MHVHNGAEYLSECTEKSVEVAERAMGLKPSPVVLSQAAGAAL